VIAVAAAVIVGLFVGSFLNVVVYRAPRGLSVVAPRSFCPTCDRQLKWWENVPVASWLVLRGRCRTCRRPISPRYLVVELVTAGSFAFVAWGFDGSSVTIGYCGLAASTISVACIEFGGIRSPLSVAAVGTGVSEVAIVVAAGLHEDWRIAVGSIVGFAIAAALFALLRTVDPDCADSRGHGRTGLLVAGAWFGGLGSVPIVVGVASLTGTYLLCLVGARLVTRDSPTRARAGRVRRAVPPALATPLVTAICVGLVVSLVVAR
jgi:leader peptidase (prepilin peptidase)/N-methyltransferase